MKTPNPQATKWWNKEITLPVWGWLVCGAADCVIHDLIKWAIKWAI